MQNYDRLLMQIILLTLLGACLWVLAPFVSALFWAAVLAFSSWPLMRVTQRLVGGSAALAAVLLTLGWVTLVAIPLVWIGANLADHIRDLNSMINDWRVSGMPDPPEWLHRIPLFGDSLLHSWQAMDAQGEAMLVTIKPYMGLIGNWLLQRSAQLGSSMLEVALSLLLLFFFYRDGPRLARFLHGLLQRLIGDKSFHYEELVASTVRQVINGVLGTAVAQAILAVIGFIIAGVPGALLLGGLTFVLSLLPMGTPLIWIPVTAWLAWSGSYGMAIFMGIWGVFVISGVDNILKPYLISRGGTLPLIVVLLGVFGGLFAFGFMGLFLGPTLLAVAYSLMDDWVHPVIADHAIENPLESDAS